MSLKIAQGAVMWITYANLSLRPFDCVLRSLLWPGVALGTALECASLELREGRIECLRDRDIRCL